MTRDNSRKLRRRVEFANPFRQGRLGIFPGGISMSNRVEPLDKVLNKLRTEFAFGQNLRNKTNGVRVWVINTDRS